LGAEPFRGECLLPRAAALRASTARLYVACRGIDQLLELDGTAVDPMRSVIQRFDLSKGVSALAIADQEGLGVVLSEFEDRLDVVSLANGSRAEIELASAPTTLSLSYRRGRALFYRTNDSRIASDGLSCASCHPDGGDDGLTWSTPEGPRQTPMLAGRLHGTEPYGWTRNMGDLPSYVGSTIQRLGGTGLSENEVVALASYIERMPSPVAQPQSSQPESEAIARGHELFDASGCASCHSNETGTDKVAHAFGNRDNEPIDTPTRRFVGLTAPYFHDGRYATLADLLGDGTNGMGGAASLSPTERGDLALYLESL
jgi:cytochrome c553